MIKLLLKILLIPFYLLLILADILIMSFYILISLIGIIGGGTTIDEVDKNIKDMLRERKKDFDIFKTSSK